MDGKELQHAIVTNFEEISMYYGLDKANLRRKNSYKAAARALADWSGPVFSGKQLKQDVKNVGESMATDIDEFISTGHMTRLDDLRQKYNDRAKYITYFSSIYGIGPVTANNFFEAGYRSLHDIYTKAKLTSAQQMGIYWRGHIGQRIPRAEMDMYKNMLDQIFASHNLTYEMVGSYRRGRPDSGDIDLIVMQRDNITMDDVMTMLKPWLAVILAQGPVYSRALWQVDPVKYFARRIDVRLFDAEVYPFMLMHSTGSDLFNINMRNQAIALGWKLNEKGLYTADNERITGIYSEADIFAKLQLPYLDPTQR